MKRKSSLKKVIMIGILACIMLFSVVLVSATQDKVILTWWSPDPVKLSEPYFEIAKAFMDKNPNIEVKIQLVPEDGYIEKSLASIAAGTPPDVLFQFDLPGFAQKGALLDLTPYIAESNFDVSVYPKQLFESTCKYKGKIYGLPRDLLLSAIYYNKDMFDKAGVAYPQDGWTTDDLLEIAKKLTDAKKREYGTVTFWWNWGSIAPSFGTKIINPEGTKVITNSPEMVAFLKWNSDLLLKYKVAPSPAMMETLGGGGGGPLELFETGKVGMIYADHWGVKIFRDDKMNFGTVEQPIMPGGKHYADALLCLWGIPNNSKHKQEAWELLKFITGPEGSEIMGKSWAIPAIPAVAKKLGFYEDPIEEAFLKQLAWEPYDMPWIRISGWWAIGSPLWDMESIIMARKSPISVEEIKKLLDEATIRAQHELDKFIKD